MEEEDLLHCSTKKSKVDAGPKSLSTRKVVSYKDVCLGVNRVDHDYQSSEEEEGGWNAHDSNESDMFEADPDEMEERCKWGGGRAGAAVPYCPDIKGIEKGVPIPWKRALIVKLLGKSVGVRFMQGWLMKLWQPQRRMEVIDLDNDYFVIRFADWGDLNKVLEGGPWVIMGHYLVIQRWKPEFRPYEDELQRVSVWICVPGLPIEYYDDHVLWRIGDVVGKTLKVDANTSRFIEDEEGPTLNDEIEQDSGEGVSGDTNREVSIGVSNQTIIGGPLKRKLQKKSQVDSVMDMVGDACGQNEESSDVTNAKLGKRESLRKIKDSARNNHNNHQPQFGLIFVTTGQHPRVPLHLVSGQQKHADANKDADEMDMECSGSLDTGQLNGFADVGRMEVDAPSSLQGPISNAKSLALAQAARPPDV
ncbi:hypothetical protein SESBI_45068 [Sesbania bispinosa]|nr:hypothetical protein SESBI_45068 [Sesbania bispinosa]